MVCSRTYLLYCCVHAQDPAIRSVFFPFRHFPLHHFTSLTTIVRFLLTQKHLISGLPPDGREDLGERFVAALAVEHPDLGVREIAELAVTATAASSASGVDDGSSGQVVANNRGDSCQNGNASSSGSKRPRLWEKLKQGGGGSGGGATLAAGTPVAVATAKAGSVANGSGHGATAAAVQGAVGGAENGGISGSSGFSFGFSFS